MGFEIPLDVDYPDHPKVQQLIALTKNREADAFPTRLWTWAAKYAADGKVKGGAAQIESICRWRGKAGALHAAMVACGFLEKDGITIHDWMARAGRMIQLYEEKKTRQREKYNAKTKGILPQNARILPAETGKNSGDKRREENGREEKRMEEKNETALRLAQKATFLQGRGTDPKSIADWNVLFTDLLNDGFTGAAIETEIDREGRHRSEKPWQFGDRIKGPKKKSEGISDEEFLRRASGKEPLP